MEGISKEGKGKSTAGGVSSGIASSCDLPQLHPPMAGPVDPKFSPRYGFVTLYGRQKETYDAVAVHPYFVSRGNGAEEKYHFFGIFDGHECSHVALSCKERMPQIVAEEIEGLLSLRVVSPVVDWKKVILRSFQRMDVEVGNSHGRMVMDINCNGFHVGSTAIVAVVGDDRIIVANCGDSRAVLCWRGFPIPLSYDHKPDRPDELQRISAAGGIVIHREEAKVFGILAISRAIGYGYLKPFVTAEPELTETARTSGDECLILASHGLWDVVTNQTACDIASTCLRRSSKPGEGVDDQVVCGSDRACSDAAMLLTNLALGRKTSDNVNVVVVDLRRGRPCGRSQERKTSDNVNVVDQEGARKVKSL